jgi:hypothetical protein
MERIKFPTFVPNTVKSLSVDKCCITQCAVQFEIIDRFKPAASQAASGAVDKAGF